ncbi:MULTISPECIES: hypothetical protein [unclassified Paenibacillus]|uniref:hypothetical protein n=1 Tax=unclassified Paenibacillus TaxID=185978 RepID=UPI000897C35C|nr:MULTISPECIES: hypothetical protein [unclassified Paenibacillus]OMC68701.1 hypothetical protein BK126_12870 [Paenibacillus sp. FSL H7-0326]SDW54552.1 hypothetical protein SAMN05518848_102116 [Paenibacillus sp. PDC88]
MENVNKAVMFLAVIETMLEALKGLPVDQTELVDSLAMLGFNPTEIMYETQTLVAFQKVCRGFAEIELTEDDLSALEQG